MGMPSNLQKAIGTVKDRTSISLEKVKPRGGDSRSCRLAILKATSHDEVPMKDEEVEVILQMASSSRAHASAFAGALGRRISRTRNWTVALKSLLLLLRFFQDGDPHFLKEVLSTMKRPAGYRVLNNLSSLSFSASWHFTAFVRTFALYLDERLHCFLTGKLVRRRRRPNDVKVKVYVAGGDMIKPPVLLDQVSHWQRLLDRAMGTRPTGPAKVNRLVHTCLYAVVQESFDLYRDISDGLALLLDSFFHLQPASCARAYKACIKASTQFSELAAFYEFCKTAGVGGRTSDYPSVIGLSDDLLDTLRDFLKHQLQDSSAIHGLRGTSFCDPSPVVISDPTSANIHSVGYDRSRSRFGWELELEDSTQRLTTSDPDQSGNVNGAQIDGDVSYNPFLHDQVYVHSPSPTSPNTSALLNFQGDPNNVKSQTIKNATGTSSPFDKFASLTIGTTQA